MELKKLKRTRAVDEVYAAIREAILTHVFEPGQRLSVDELADKLGVSLTPVRSAIQMLTAEGLIEIRPRSGTFVAALSRRDVEETFTIRLALELAALERAALRMCHADVLRLRQQSNEVTRVGQQEGSRELHDDANREFHHILIRASDNKRLADMYDGLNAHLQIARIHAARDNWRIRLTAEQREHEAIVHALERGDTEAAVKAMKAHIEGARTALLQQLEEVMKVEGRVLAETDR